ncbi:Unknown protein [Striga hermonthica]|uniref:F-box domain-containing protein n=1 Tax=Striga hermonthica TaxID=68872 RepID=A0A9N7N6Q4_STRHE|nr:Unknown protein [Striga hermonthica]
MDSKRKRSGRRRKIFDGERKNTAAPSDRISALPDDVILHILSFLSLRRSVQTSILAKRWRFLWAHASTLDFSFEITDLERLGYAKDSPEIVNKVMSQLKGKNIDYFCLRYFEPFFYKSDEMLETWIATLVNRNVCRLHFDVINEMPMCLFTCKTLVDLSLHESCCPVLLAGSVCLPVLKKLQMWYVSMSESDESFKNLIAGCPMLEELIIWRSFSYFLSGCFVSPPSLTRLELRTETRESVMETVLRAKLDTPAVRYIDLTDIRSENFSSVVLDSLIEADIGMNVYDPDVSIVSHSMIPFLRKLQNVKCLTLSTPWMEVPNSAFHAMAIKFPNLTKLRLFSDFRFISFFLENAENLQMITIIPEFGDYGCWIEPKHVPVCLLSHLRTVWIHQFECSEREFNMGIYNGEESTLSAWALIIFEHARSRCERMLIYGLGPRDGPDSTQARISSPAHHHRRPWPLLDSPPVTIELPVSPPVHLRHAFLPRPITLSSSDRPPYTPPSGPTPELSSPPFSLNRPLNVKSLSPSSVAEPSRRQVLKTPPTDHLHHGGRHSSPSRSPFLRRPPSEKTT